MVTKSKIEFILTAIYGYSIILEDRIQQVAAEITKYLKSTDRMAKTIVFCATEDAAERMRMALSISMQIW